MSEILKFVGFSIDSQKFALPMVFVNRVIHVVEISPLPQTPAFIQGIINFHGDIIPVINMRSLFGLQQRDIELTDKLLIADIPSGKFAFLVDSTQGILEIEKNEILKTKTINYGDKFFHGIIKQQDGMILINDVEKFLSKDELLKLELAIKKNKEPEILN